VLITDLFTIKNGHGLDLVNLTQVPKAYGIAYVSCGEPNNGVSGWVKNVEGVVPFEPGTISVVLTGNSVLAAFVQVSRYYTASHMAVLTPKNPTMTVSEKLWWASCIRANRYRFGFGRKADRTIRMLVLPDEVPDWVTDANASAAVHDLANAIPTIGSDAPPKMNCHVQTVGDLFSIKRGHQLDLTHLDQVAPLTGIAYVSCTDKNNGVSGWVSLLDGIEPAKSGTISVALVGSTLAAYVQPKSYYTAQNVEVLTPLDGDMTFSEKMWWASCIRANRYRYNYGRKANRTFRSLVLPSVVPAWVHTVPHDAAVELRETVEEIADMLEPSEFQKFTDLELVEKLVTVHANTSFSSRRHTVPTR
jgi:hypothetical protein